MQVVVIGPNLLDQSKGSFHVHKSGCADTAKSQYRFHKSDVEHPVSVETKREVVEYVYDPGDFDYDPDTELSSYASDVYFFPCTDELRWSSWRRP